MFDDDLLAYAEAHSTPETPQLAKLNRDTHLTQVCPQMLSGHIQGALLTFISRMMKPQRILEIGTFTGYSAVCLAAGLEERGGFLHTIEVNPEQEDGINSVLRDAGLQDRVILHIGDAREIIPALDETWDIVFIDADKDSYRAYYEMVLPRIRPGGIIIADNVLWDGKVLGPREKMDRDTLGICEFNEFVRDDPRVEQFILPVRDGMMIVSKLQD